MLGYGASWIHQDSPCLKGFFQGYLDLLDPKNRLAVIYKKNSSLPQQVIEMTHEYFHFLA